MHFSILMLSVALLHGGPDTAVAAAAKQFMPDVRWRAASVLHADFTCRGHQESAILGVSDTNVVIAVFLEGLAQRPEVLRYSFARDTATLQLTTEGLDWDPKAELGYALPGFQRSQTCQGLNLYDGEVDAAHIYWDHDAHQFEDWVR